jgi:hypothetical protein
MQGLDPPVHHLGKAGQLGDILHRQAGVGDGLGGPAGGDELDAEARERPRRLHQAGLVGDGQQGPAERDPIGRGREIRGGGHGGLLA